MAGRIDRQMLSNFETTGYILKESDDNKSESEHVTAKLSKASEEPEQKGSWSDGWMED